MEACVARTGTEETEPWRALSTGRLHTDFRHFTSTQSMGRTRKALSIVKPSTRLGPDSGRGRASFLSSGVCVARTWVPGVWHL